MTWLDLIRFVFDVLRILMLPSVRTGSTTE